MINHEDLKSNLSPVITEFDMVFSGKSKLQKNSNERKFRNGLSLKEINTVRLGISKEELAELSSVSGEAPENFHIVFYESANLSPEAILNLFNLMEIKPDKIKAIESLTECEMKMLIGLTRCLSYQKIADQHFVALDTVKGHIYNVFRKLEVNNRYSASGIYIAYLIYRRTNPLINQL